MSPVCSSPVTPKRVAIYTRYSSDMQRPATLEDQERNCREYAGGQGWVVLDDYVCSDAAKTGRTLRHRQKLDYLLTASKEKQRPFDVLIVDEGSRLTRKLKDALTIADILQFYGVRLVIVNRKLDSDDPNFQNMITLIGMVDEQNSELMRHRVRRGQVGRARKGHKPGGRCYGYKSVSVMNVEHPELTGRAAIDGYKWQVYEPQAAVLRRIFRLYADGLSVSDIVTTLNREGIPAASPPRIAPGRTWWSASLVKRILKNEKYTGKLIYGKTSQYIHPETGKTVTRKNDSSLWTTFDDPDARIIPDELWNRVQERLNVVNEKMKRYRIAALNRAGRRDYLFSGLLECGMCNSPMVISGNDPGYVCTSHRHNRGCKNDLWIKEKRLSSQLVAALAKNLLVPKVLDYFIDSVSLDFERYMKGMPSNGEESYQSLHKREATLKQSCECIFETMKNPVSANSTFLPQKLAEVESELAKVRMQIQVWDAPKTMDEAKLDIAVVVKRNVSSLLEIIKQDVPKARAVLQRRIKKLQLIPVTSADGPAYEVLGEIDLFTSLTSRKKSVLLDCSSR